MFSEYASRFLQQSNNQLPLTQDRQPLDRRRFGAQQGQQHISGSRYVQRPSQIPLGNGAGGNGGAPQTGNPSASQSRFPFASRLSRQADPQQAPLFFSATDDFQEEDEGEEHEREVADLYALQRSRQHFGRSNLTESSEYEDEGAAVPEAATLEGQRHERDDENDRGRVSAASRGHEVRDQSAPESLSSAPSSKAKGRLVEVDLASTINEEPPESLVNPESEAELDDPPPPFQTFRPSGKDTQSNSFMPVEADEEANIAMPRPVSPDRESVPPTVILPAQQPPKHDAFWASLFEICLFAMFAAFVLIWFSTSAPGKGTPIGDTVYSALRGSTNMLLWDTMIAIVVALVWLALLRHHVRNLVYLMLLAVPVIMFAFSLYPLISSFKGNYHGNALQDKLMRWLSFVPALLGALWTWSVIQNRHSLARSIHILEFSTKILTASPWLITLGFATLGVVVVFTWIWMLMFERIFLSGHFANSGAKKWIIDANSWWLGAYFVLQYLWTLGVIAGIQRATSAATVSQWYFHRLAVPQPTSQQVVRASFQHATDALFGTVCLSTFLSLLVRLPLIILPGRLSGLLNMCAYWIIPSSLATLTNPLTLTYAAIHSQPLSISARGLANLSFISSRTNPSTTLGPGNFRPRGSGTGGNGYYSTAPSSALLPYRLAKLLLHATRFVMSAGLGIGGWVRTARNLSIEAGGAAGSVRGSLYAYIVGFIAGTIGFAVLGAVENVVGAVLDAAVICWASETGGRTEARFCREAGELFGEDGRF